MRLRNLRTGREWPSDPATRMNQASGNLDSGRWYSALFHHGHAIDRIGNGVYLYIGKDFATLLSRDFYLIFLFEETALG